MENKFNHSDDNSKTFDMSNNNITQNHASKTQNSILINDSLNEKSLISKNDSLNNCQFCNNNNEKLFRYLKDNELIYCCKDCLIPNMFKDIKNIENFKLFLKDYDAEINIKEINFNNHNIKLKIKPKGEWENNINKAYLMYVIPEKGILSDEYEIIFKDGMKISNMINLNFDEFKDNLEITIIFFIRPTKYNYFGNIENMSIKILF